MASTVSGPSLLDVIQSFPLGRYLWRAVRLPLSLGLAVLAQARFISERDNATGGIFLLVVAVCLFLLSLIKDRWQIPRGETSLAPISPSPDGEADGRGGQGVRADSEADGRGGQGVRADSEADGRGGQGVRVGEEAEPAARAQTQISVRWPGVAAGAVLSLLTYWAATGLSFTTHGVILWIASSLAWLYAFWEGGVDVEGWLERSWAWLRSPWLDLRVSRSALLFLAMMAVAAFVRFYRLADVPPEMTSDHVEKLLDVNDVLNGERPLFFPRNTGREPMQFYLAALTSVVLGTGRTFLTLKIVAALMGFLTIPSIYLLGRELGDEALGLIAGTLASLSLWPETISRVGLRFPFGPVFVAPVLFFLFRGLRRGRRNDLLLAGFFLGAGLYGYTAFRIVPLVVAAIGFIFAFRRSPQSPTALVAQLLMAAFVALAVFVPLFTYTVANPEMFWYRTLGRVADTETQLPGPAWQIFLSNQWNGIRMFNWTSDQVWVNTVPGRPVLDTLSGGVFVLGVAYLLYRLARRPNATDLSLLVAVPLLLLPSTLSLAFPNENPSVVRTAGAIPLVFVIAAFPLRLWMAQAHGVFGARYGRALGVGAIVAGLALTGREVFHQYFVAYPAQYMGGAQNASELGAVVRGFAQSVGTYDTAWVKAYPYWVDTRAVGIYSGKFGWDNVFIEPDEFAQTLAVPDTKLFIVKADDVKAIAVLRALYPGGLLTYHTSRFPGKDFLTFLVPAIEDFDESQLPPPPG